MTETSDPWLIQLLLWTGVAFLVLLFAGIGAVFAIDWWRGRGEHREHVWREREMRRDHS